MLIYLPYLTAYNVQSAMPDVRVVTVNETDAILAFEESSLIQFRVSECRSSFGQLLFRHYGRCSVLDPRF